MSTTVGVSVMILDIDGFDAYVEVNELPGKLLLVDRRKLLSREFGTDDENIFWIDGWMRAGLYWADDDDYTNILFVPDTSKPECDGVRVRMI